VGPPGSNFSTATPDTEPGAPLLVPVRCDGREVVAVTDQIRIISKQRLDRRLGELSTKDLAAVGEGLREVLEL